MDEMHEFELLVAEETLAEAGPPRPTDVAAVVRTVATKSPSWRFWSMFTATKMLTATTVAAFFGGLLLVGPLQTSQQAEVRPAAVAGEDGGPTEFRARWVRGGDVDRGVVEAHGDLTTYRDQRWGYMIEEAGDPRLDGEIAAYTNVDIYSGLAVPTGYYRIETDDGAWQGRPTILGLALTGSRSVGYTAVFDGEGAYEGLTAILSFTDDWVTADIEGVILDASLPPEPVPAN